MSTIIVTVRATRPSSRDLTSPQDAKFRRGARGRPHRESRPRRLRACVRHPSTRTTMSIADTPRREAMVATSSRSALCAGLRRAARRAPSPTPRERRSMRQEHARIHHIQRTDETLTRRLHFASALRSWMAADSASQREARVCDRGVVSAPPGTGPARPARRRSRRADRHRRCGATRRRTTRRAP